ncbi:MAG: hypothetical protein EAZ37_09550 [Burkholderiales bacterium]|nr:MAG: hypothetical protein EAZ37_09550 [Burkholderiales bacterium]
MRLLDFRWRSGGSDLFRSQIVAEPAIATAHPPPQMSPGWRFARASSFILLRWIRHADGCEGR